MTRVTAGVEVERRMEYRGGGGTRSFNTKMTGFNTRAPSGCSFVDVGGGGRGRGGTSLTPLPALSPDFPVENERTPRGSQLHAPVGSPATSRGPKGCDVGQRSRRELVAVVTSPRATHPGRECSNVPHTA